MMSFGTGVPGRGAARRGLALLGLPAAWGAAAITYKLACPLAQQTGLGARLFTSAVFFAVGTGIVLRVRRALLSELRQVRRVAGAAQEALLGPLPGKVGGLEVAAAQLSAERGACIGGDLYDVIATEHGVRVVMGDVRGHGLAAIGTVAAVLGSFREAAHDERDLAGVLRRLERALARHLRQRACPGQPVTGPDCPAGEEFVTVLLLEIRPDGDVRALNCGHPRPHLLRDGQVEAVDLGEPLPPLGPFPLPAELAAVPVGWLRPGDTLFLHTDGADDARDPHGRFFSLADALRAAVRDGPEPPQTVLGAVWTRLLRHAGGWPTDDVAMLALRDARRAAALPLPGGPVGQGACQVP
ncbi:PP2C family protein-serine/threonine phosphatase [Streptomyces sp. NPDC056716]|uniref:PP2C family protein-serine/threonine phosphatase n=1 Tax=unclassified Streptomyces TaxID=2593676 RepID=UPI00369C67E2